MFMGLKEREKSMGLILLENKELGVGLLLVININ